MTVTTSDVEEISGIDSKAGNAGQAITEVEPHNWYIVNIDGCQ